MKCTVNRAIFFIISFLLINVAFAQSLYWVGSSGNYNDPKHWSRTSGGVPAFVLPDKSTDVVFDDNSGNGYYSVNFDKSNSAKNFVANSFRNVVSFEGSKSSVVYIGGSFYLSPLVKYASQAEMIFNSNLSTENSIEFGLNELACNLYFNDGVFKFYSVLLKDKNSVTFGKGQYNFNQSVLVASNVYNSVPGASFNIIKSYFKTSDYFKISESAKVISDKFYLVANKKSSEKFSLPSSVLANTSNTFVNYMAPICNLTINAKPACSGPCSGVLTISFSPGCVDPPYDVLVNNPTCPATAGTLSANNVTSVSLVYTAVNACTCSTNYQVLVFDVNSNFVSQNVNFIVNPALVTNVNTLPTCANLCNGKMTGNIFGTPPFSVAISPSTVTPTFTTNLTYTLNNLCAGVYTFDVTDANGCLTSITKTLSAPLPILPNSVTSSISCNGVCNGSFQITPTQGTPGYTVSFSTGPVFTVAAAGSASIVNLCPGPYSATITDAFGCTTLANTNINQPPALVITPTQTNLTCFTNCNGGASVAVSGGTPVYSYTWTPGPGGNVSGISSLCSGNQTVTISDFNNCVQTRTFNISSPPAITLTTISQSITCNSSCNGSATVTASGGTGVISHTWTGPAPFASTSASVITNLCPGIYTVTALDAGLCPAQTTISISEPSAYTITTNKIDNTCFSNCAGAATVAISGGNGGPFTYTWTPGVTIPQGQGTATLSNLCFGTYTLNATGSGPCPVTTTLTITQPTSITPNITSGSVTCNAACNGSINTSPVGGAGGPYTITLFTPFATTITTAPPFTNLCAGIYTLTIRDASLCLVSQTINITQPNPLVTSITSASISCFGVCNGALAGSVLGGTPGYTLFWSTPTGTVAGGNIINLCTGNYTFNVSDANSCTVSSTFSLTQPADLTATLTPFHPTCNGSCNGSITANIAGGTPGYTLNWSSGSGNPNINRCAGVYTLIVTDSKGCNKPFTSTLTAPPSLSISLVTSSTSCAASCDGSATVTATGGTGLLTYQFNTIPVTTNTTGIISGLCPGNYIVNVTDANGCSLPQAFNISAPPLLTAAIIGIKPTCNVCTGASTVSIGGGTPGYTVNWTNTVSAVVATGTVASGLCLGTYTANVIDSKGCTTTASVSIVNTVSVTVITGGSPILCFGACNASATANAIGGTLPYIFSWNSAPTQTTSTASNLCAGNYTVTVTDNDGCSNTGSISIAQPSSITVNSSQTNIACFSSCNGAITTTVSGGTPVYSYSWSPGGQTTTSLTNLCVGIYTLNITDLNNCSRTVTFNVVDNPSITATFTTTNPSGCTILNGSICATPSGGAGGPYQFTWTPAGSGGANNPCNVGLTGGSYSLTILDVASGCTASLSASLSNPVGPTLAISNTSVTCFGANNGSATAIATGGGPYTFTWSPPTASAVVGATTTATGLGTGNYNVSVTDFPTGCITSQTFNVVQPPSFTLSTNVTHALCNGSSTGSITAVVSGGTPTYAVNWLPAGTGTAIVNQPAGNYTVNVIDANGCPTSQTFVINQPGALTVTATQTNVSCNSFTNAAISLTVTGGTPAYNFSWTPVGTFTGSINNPLTNIGANIYTVTVTDLNNCTSVQSYTVFQPTALGHTISTTNLACNASCIGTASQVVTGGTPTYSFSWSSTAATTQSLNSLCAGSYTANVVDANGCVSSLSFAITQPTSLNVTVTPTSPLCNNSCNGSITAAVSGGTPTYTLNWLPAGSGGTITNLCSGNYTLTVTDASLCTTNAVVTLTNPPAIAANISFTNPTCNNSCNGIAVSNPVNAASPISYSWSTVPTTTINTATGLCGGNTYTLFITDANNCTVTPQTVSLIDPAPLNVLASSLPATCLGPPDGSMTVSPSGGTPTYSYTWIPAALGTNSFVNNVAAGIYTVTVIDANGCTNSVSIIVNNSNGPNSAPVTFTNVNCFGQCTGAASIGIITGGNPGYVVSWVTPVPATTVNPIVNLCAGTWTAQIEDALGCKLFTTVAISQPSAAIDDNEVISMPLCAGVCSGSVVLNPTGGTPPYVNFSWSPSASTTGTATNLCVGVHTASITDNLGCLFTATYALVGQTVVTSAIASTSNICFGNCLAISSVTASGGLAPYSFNWSNTQTGPIASNLCNGNYSVTITDFNGCQNTFTTDIVSPAAITATSGVSSPSCGLCNGSSTVNVLGGTAPYTYSWTTGGITPTEIDLCAGLYQVLITDFNGCTQLNNVLISNSSGITGESFNIQNELCFNDCSGSVTVTPIGGTAPIAFNWISPISTNSIITNLCAGTYFFQMQDAQGCIRTSSVAVGSATNIIITPTITAPSCALNNGTITVGVTGGSGTYTINWLPAGSTATLNNIGAGIYTVTVFDGNCTKTLEVNVNTSVAPMILFTKTDNGCSSGLCTGSVVITPTLGTPAYIVNWSNGNVTNTVTTLCQGIITVTVTDAVGCVAVQSFSISENPAINLSLPQVSTLLCNSNCDGSITIVPSGGVLPYVITWVPTNTATPSNPYINLCAGNYTALVTDINGCTATQTMNLANPPSFTIDANIINATCASANDGAATTTVSGGTPAYTYSWTGPSTHTTQSISNVSSGIYSLSITDINGCVKDTVFNIIPTITVTAIAGNDTSFCINNTIILNGINSLNALTYEWMLAPSATTIANTPTTSVLPSAGSNTYILLVTSSIAACFDSDTIVVNAFSLPIASAGPSQTISLFTSTQIGGSPTSASAISYTWIPSANLNDMNSPNPVASNTVNTTFTVFVTDANGCISSDTVHVHLYPEIIIPNGFSPNADGRNDKWIIDNIQQFPENVVEVYNRWGELLFQSKGYAVPFDGRYKNKDLPVGTYYYIINLNHVAYPKAYTGPLTIFR